MDAKSPPMIRPPGFHRLPQIPMVGRNVRTAQSKSSARQSMESKVLIAADIASTDEVDNLNIHLWTKTESEAAESTPSAKNMTDIKTTEKVGEETTCDKTSSILVSKDTDIKGAAAAAAIMISPGQLTVAEKRKRRSSKRFEIDAEDEKPLNQAKKRGRKSKDRTSDLMTNRKSDGKSSDPKSKRVRETTSAQDPSSMVAQEENKAPQQNRIIQSPLEKKKSRSKLELELKAMNQIKSDFEIKPATPEQMVETSGDPEAVNSEQVQLNMHIPRCVIITPAEVPSEAVRNGILERPPVAVELEYPILWKQGDMFWGKVSGHPCWPCMISPCPFTKLLTRVKVVGRPFRMYHVQYFGDSCERGWVRETSLIGFQGKEHFLELAKSSSAAKTAKYGKGNNPFKVSSSVDWTMSVEEAEVAFKLSLEERIVQYTFDYLFLEKNNKKKTSTASPVPRKRKKSTSVSPDAPLAKKPKLDNDTTPALSSSGKKQSQSVGTLDVYDFDKQMSPVKQAASTTNSPVTGKRSKKPTMKLVESILQASPASKKGGSPGSVKVEKRGRPRKIPLPEIQMTNAGNDQEVVPALPLASPAPQVSHPSPVGVSPKKRGRPRKYPIEATMTASADPEKKSEDKVFSDTASTSSPMQCAEASTPQPVKRQSLRKSLQTKEKESVASPTVEDQEHLDSSSPKYSLVPEVLFTQKSSQDSDSNASEVQVLQNKPKKVKEPYELEVFKLQSTTKTEKEHICSKCENNGDLIECHGSCGRYFHLTCLSAIPANIGEFKCDECTTGIHPCFSCKVSDPSTKKCSVHQCGKYYHETCVQRLRLTRIVGDNKGFICPLHACTTCAVDNIKNIKATKGRLFRCIRCPTAYHHGDFCIAAGSEVLGGGYILCSNHFRPNKSQSSHAHFNINWCFICNRGGALLCCESCPASYHPDCIKVEKTPDEAWFCEECHAGRKPLYGNIVWIKVGNYRWWPGEVCHPRHVPFNIQEKAHQVGEFPVRFFGSHDYYWIHKGRVFLFEDGDKASRDHSSKNLYKVYSKGVEEATDAFNQWKAVMERKEEQEQEKSFKKPSTFKFLKRNFPIGNVQVNIAELSEIPRCECKEDQDDPCSSDCLNRMMMYECHPQVCPAGDKCHNQRFQKRQYPECEPFKSEGRGWGLRANEDMKKGQFVMEYVGDLIDDEECKRRIEIAHENNITNFYMLTMDKNRTIDAGPRGNNSRFMNHSCCPNLVTQKWMVNGDIRVGLFTLCDIPKGTELTFNYNLECLGNEKTACACGAENCSGFLGVRPKTAAAIANEKKMKEMKKMKKKKKIILKKATEDECFRCGEGGELVMCDKGSCPKVYHLQCLKLTKPPTGKWSCPWHHCDDCGKPATNLCSECPNSFCPAHIEGNISTVDGALVCVDHEDEDEDEDESVHSSPKGQSVGTQIDDKLSEEDSEETKRKSLVQKALFTSDKDVDRSKIGNGTLTNGKKVAKRKSFKDILNERSSPLELNDVSIPVFQKEKKQKVLHNGHSMVNGDVDSKDIDGPGEKIGIFLKKTTVPSKKGGKPGHTKTRYKSQLLSSSPHKYMLNSDQEDIDSESDLVIDIP